MLSHDVQTTNAKGCSMKNYNKMQTAAANRAVAFKRWILRQVQTSGKYYSVSSAKQYVAQLRNYAHKLSPRALEGTGVPEDLFELGHRLEFDTMISIISELPGYDEFIAGNHGNFNAAKDLYRQFLEAIH